MKYHKIIQYLSKFLSLNVMLFFRKKLQLKNAHLKHYESFRTWRLAVDIKKKQLKKMILMKKLKFEKFKASRDTYHKKVQRLLQSSKLSQKKLFQTNHQVYGHLLQLNEEELETLDLIHQNKTHHILFVIRENDLDSLKQDCRFKYFCQLTRLDPQTVTTEELKPYLYPTLTTKLEIVYRPNQQDPTTQDKILRYPGFTDFKELCDQYLYFLSFEELSKYDKLFDNFTIEIGERIKNGLPFSLEQTYWVIGIKPSKIVSE